jgi:hypothetical protein
MALPDYLWGPLLEAAGSLPLHLTACLGDLRPRFILKGRVGQGYRAVARNGRILLAADRALAELADQPVRIRLQPWHRVLLPGDMPEPYGILLCIRGLDALTEPAPYTGRLVASPEPGFALILDVGGRRFLEFRRRDESVSPG